MKNRMTVKHGMLGDLKEYLVRTDERLRKLSGSTRCSGPERTDTRDRC